MSAHESPIFITITGGKGAGKTSILNIVGARLRDLGMDVSCADNNGADIVQATILDGNIVLAPNSPIFITTSDRAKTETPSA